MQPSELQLFFSPKDRLRCTVGTHESYITVKPVWASPITFPGQYLALLDGKDNEITTIRSLDELEADSRKAVETELNRRYLTSIVTHIEKATVEFGATYWHVQTHRGEKDFVTQSLQENAVWMSESHLLLVDVDGNRFEIPDIARLDEKSQSLLHKIV